MELMFAPLRRYADFQGRSRRSEYWLFVLFYIVVYAILAVIGAVIGGRSADGSPGGAGMFLPTLFALGVFVPMLAVSVRRLHDTDRSGWWILLGLIPLLGGLVVFIFDVLDGTPGPNKFGPDPKGRGANTADVFS